jgi:hypothetical protein
LVSIAREANMITGKLMVMGTFTADGEQYEGVVVQTGKDVLRGMDGRDPRLYEDVCVIAPARQNANSASVLCERGCGRPAVLCYQCHCDELKAERESGPF